jgi:nucleotide-binding universal stress UspA family protein
MRRILIPLDGTELAASILPDAERYAGPDGELILIRDAGWGAFNPRTQFYGLWPAIEATDKYLEEQARTLSGRGVRVRAHRAVFFNPSAAVDEAAALMKVDMIACATHGRGPLGRFFHGNIAWKMLAGSPVPVLLRHPPVATQSSHADGELPQRRILVPLDGSTFAESALPLARQLAEEWQAPIYLLQVVNETTPPSVPTEGSNTVPASVTDDPPLALAYLKQIAERMSGEVHADILLGTPAADRIVEFASANAISDVVLSSHGRTGLSRLIFGSVADGLIQRLHCPIVVVPAQAVKVSAELDQKIGSAPEVMPASISLQ